MAKERKKHTKDELTRDNFKLAILLATIAVAIYIGFISAYVI